MPPFFKFITVAFIWGMIAIITILQLIVNDGANFNWVFTVAMTAIASASTSTILNDGDKGKKRAIEINTTTNDHSSDHSSATTSKRKNDQAGGLSPDMLALLDEDDLAELRQRVKNRLMDRIDGGSDGELSSLDALLADQDEAPQRKSRR